MSAAPRSIFRMRSRACGPTACVPGQQHLSADQTFFGLPGVVVANRTNPSQDIRVAVRGFGSRSSFGVRSVRILRDGMPLTNADGQTPLDYLDLENVGRIEVIRGTASSLYGNASGGVLDIRSADAADRRLCGAAAQPGRLVRDLALHGRGGRIVQERQLLRRRRPHIHEQLS